MYVIFYYFLPCLWRIPHTGGLVNKANEVGLIKTHILSLMGHYLPFLCDKSVLCEKWIKKKQKKKQYMPQSIQSHEVADSRIKTKYRKVFKK